MESNGSIKVNLFSKDDPHWASFENFVGKPGKAYVGGHGTPDAMYDDRNGKKGIILSSVEVGKLVLASGGTQETPIDLHSCEVGRGPHSFARELSSYFPTVRGATGVLAELGSRNEEEFNYFSAVANNGKLKTFHSEDRELAKYHPEKIDTPESERPSAQYNKIGIQTKRAWDQPAGEMPPPVTNRDIGDEKPVTNPSNYSKRLDIDHYHNMAIEYKNAVNADDFNQARKQAEIKYDELKIVFLAREELQKAHPEPAALKGFDGYAVNTIERDKVFVMQEKSNNANQKTQVESQEIRR